MTKCIELLTEVAPEFDDARYFEATDLLRDKELQKTFIFMPI